jgi:CubicO group peptidase (beta-lactamase class C family)
MCSGISGDELTYPSEFNTWAGAPDQLTYTLGLPMAGQPGVTFYYSTGASHLASAILTQATGMSTFQFAKQFLFQPLGIEDHDWITDKRGIYYGGAGLSLTPQDMIKFGELYLNKGLCKGIQVVSEEWINKATSFKISTNNIQPFAPTYGYFWWSGNINHHSYYFANGYGGQFIVIVPDLKLIVVATNKWSGIQSSTANEQWYKTIEMIINKIIPLYN